MPAPPLNPKFIKYNTTEHVTPKQEQQSLLSSLFRKENFHQFIGQIDDDFGMTLNPLQVHGFLDGSDPDVIFSNNAIPLHAKDRALLRDAGIGKINKSEPGVSFLRRTEYIADRQSAVKLEETAASLLEERDDRADPESQLKAVEKSFDDAQETFSNFELFRHPRKKHLRAVLTFQLLPDTAMMDTNYLTVKFTGSASINRDLEALKRQKKDTYDAILQKDALKCAIYRPITSEDGEWVSLYQNKDPRSIRELREKLDSLEREQPANSLADNDEDLPSFRFRHYKNYDMSYQRSSKPYGELAIKFVSDENTKKRRAAYYSPISGKVELKKYRASTNTEINRFLHDSTVDVLNFKLREPNTDELKKMDTIRSEYDPMEYEGEGDDDSKSDVDSDVADEFDKATEKE